ncbi:MAG: LacI family DNA-binding transcriptional regulator [Clostridia bacterium]|nr:LacI family DNA-binding transcriptional regulator [Clostridia bacterium]
MEKTQPTLKDLAERLNLSVGTVQRALNNKGGYKPETQRRVLEEAEKIGYTVNPAASALRRPPVSIAVVLPEPIDHNKYFYQYVWQGIEYAYKELAVFQVGYQKMFIHPHSSDFCDVLEQLSASDKIQGIITVLNRDARFDDIMRRFAQRGIPVSFINAGNTLNDTRFSVSTGGLAADILASTHTSVPGQVLLLGGSYENELHRRRAMDFSQKLREYCANISVLEIHEYHDLKKLRGTIASMLKNLDTLTGIFSVSTRETLCMCQAVSEMGFSGKMMTIGVDAFPELLPFFQNGTLTSSIYHYPTRLAYSVFYQLVSQLTSIPTPYVVQSIPAVPIFRSNADFFCKAEGII